MGSSTKEILDSLKPLFDKAEKENLWFYCYPLDVLLSPKELKKAQKEGRYIWGTVNWDLVSPNERLDELIKERDELDKEIAKFKKRMIVKLRKKTEDEQ